MDHVFQNCGITADVPTRLKSDACVNLADFCRALGVFFINALRKNRQPMVALGRFGMVNVALTGKKCPQRRDLGHMGVESFQRLVDMFA